MLERGVQSLDGFSTLDIVCDLFSNPISRRKRTCDYILGGNNGLQVRQVALDCYSSFPNSRYRRSAVEKGREEAVTKTSESGNERNITNCYHLHVTSKAKR